MDASTFDPTRAVVFDLNRGQVRLDGGGAVVVLPAEALAQLDAATVRQFGALLGRQAGLRVRTRLATGTLPTLELMVDQLGGEMALAGFGSLSMERWGQALVAVIENCPLGEPGHDLMSAYVESALLVAVGREVVALVLEHRPQSLRLLLCGKVASARVKGWIAAGGNWGDALVALHQNPRNDVARGRL